MSRENAATESAGHLQDLRSSQRPRAGFAPTSARYTGRNVVRLWPTGGTHDTVRPAAWGQRRSRGRAPVRRCRDVDARVDRL